jgi:hypothetical protein
MIDLASLSRSPQEDAQAAMLAAHRREQDAQIRVTALQLAANVLGGSNDPKAVLNAAASFEAFILGSPQKTN